MPIARITPKRQTEEAAGDKGPSLASVRPGRYPVLVKKVEENVVDRYKTGIREGQSYTSTRITLELTVGGVKLDFPVRLFPKSKAETSLIKAFAEDATVNSFSDLTGKTLQAYLDRNKGGFLNAVEFSRA